MSDNEQLGREFTDEERQRLVDYFSLLIEIDQQEKARFAKLKDFRMDSLWTAKVASAGYVSNPYMILPVGSTNGVLNAQIAKMQSISEKYQDLYVVIIGMGGLYPTRFLLRSLI